MPRWSNRIPVPFFRTNSRDQPVVVVGAAGAGLYASYLLAQRNVPVHIYERCETFSPRARTLIVTPELERVLGYSAGRAIVNRVHTLELCAGERAIPIRLREPDLIVERAELLRLLAAKAQAAGAQLFTGQCFEQFETDGRRVTMSVRQRGTDRVQHLVPSAIIAADGVRSQVARCLGDEPQPTVSVVQARVALRKPADPGIGKVWFAPRETPFFYWLCPESATTAAVGLVDVSPATMRAKLDGFLHDRDMEPLEYQAAVVPLYRPGRSHAHRLGRTDIMMVGDAAGQVK